MKSNNFKANKITTVISGFGLGMLTLMATPSFGADIPGAVNDHVRLGTAYNSISGEFLNFQTAQGQIVELSAGTQGQPIFTSEQSFEQLSTVIGGELSASVDFPAIQADANVEIALSMASTEYSSNWMYAITNKGKTLGLRGFGPQSRLEISAQGDDVVAKNYNDSQLLKAAGDAFISDIEYSNQFFILIKTDYLSQEDKSSFSGDINVDFSAANIEASGAYLNDEVKRSITLTIRAFQFGGEPLNLLSTLTEDIASCTLADLTACQALLSEAIDYAKSEGAYVNNGFNQQVASPANSNVSGYNYTLYAEDPGFLDLLPQAPNGYTADNNDITLFALQNEYSNQLKYHARAVNLLTKSRQYINITQLGALRNIVDVALNNAQTMQDLSNYCNANGFNGDCQSYIDTHCPRVGVTYSCLTEFNLEVLDIPRISQLAQTQQVYDRSVKLPSINEMGLDLMQLPDVSMKNASGNNLNYDKVSGKVSGAGGAVISTSYNANIEFMVKSSRKLTNLNVASGNVNGHFNVKVYQDDGWQNSQRSSGSANQTVLNEASSVDGFYHYLIELNDINAPLISLTDGSNQNIDLYFYAPSVLAIAPPLGSNADNTPMFFSARNIEVDKDINGNVIGYCPEPPGLTRDGGTDYCLRYGRVYQWDDAAKACEAFSEAQVAKTGLTFRLPSFEDYRALVAPITAETGEGNEASWLKSYQYNTFKGAYLTNNATRFNFQPGGQTFSGSDETRAPFSSQGTFGAVWTSSTLNNLRGLLFMEYLHGFVGIGGYIQSTALFPVRCIGSYNK